MSINLAEIQQKQDRLLANIAEQNRKAYEMFYSPIPLNVELPQYDELGNLITVTIPNRAKIKEQMWDDVGAAIGQFDRYLYVDAVNGDDLNTGTSLSPLKTIKAAVDAIPVGGRGTIYLKGGDVFNVTELGHISVKNKTLYFYNYDYATTNTHTTFIFNNILDSYGNNYLQRFSCEGSCNFMYNGVDIQLADKSDPNSSWSHASIHYGLQSAEVNVYTRSSRVALHADAYNSLLGSYGSYGGTYGLYAATTDFIANGGTIMNLTNTNVGKIAVDAYSTIDDSTKWVGGIVKDANGVPRNIISNIVF